MALLKNTWYMAAWAHELDEKNPLSRTVADIPVVLYRTESGKVVALMDRCPHRFAPLSLGRVKGEDIQCGYHGLTFNCEGTCIDNPSGTMLPTKAKVQNFPLIVRDRIIWIWMGDHDKVDEATIPEYSNHDDENFHFIFGYIFVEAHHELISDNLLDLMHVTYLHPGFGGENFKPVQTIEQSEGEVRSKYLTSAAPNSDFGELLLPTGGEPVDEYDVMRWNMPSYLKLSSTYTLPGAKPETGATNWTSHLLTPAAGNTTHYFWASAVPTGTPLDDDKHRDFLTQVFNDEDKPMISAVQERMGDCSFSEMNQIFLETDNAALRARKMLSSAIKNEQQESDKS